MDEIYLDQFVLQNDDFDDFDLDLFSQPFNKAQK